ncbi:MAG TPA: SURF1 family protein [Solimonas sp.]
MATWTFRPPWWASIGTVLASAVMCGLGYWQLQRGFEKVELQSRYVAAEARPVRLISAGSVADPSLIERAQVQGRYDASRQLLLDNQSHDRKPGYQVLTPLLMADGSIAIVNRGWIPLPRGGETPDLSVTGDEVQFQALWRTLPAPAIRLDVDNCAGSGWPRVVQYPTIAELRCLYGEFVAEGVLLLDPAATDGYVRQWDRGVELSPTKNYAYAAQWFAFALTLIAIFVKLNLRRPS